MGRPWYFRLPIFSGLILHFFDFLAQKNEVFFSQLNANINIPIIDKEWTHTLQYEVITSWSTWFFLLFLMNLWAVCDFVENTDIPTMELVYFPYIYPWKSTNLHGFLWLRPNPTQPRTASAPSTAGRSTGPTLARRGWDVLLTSAFRINPPMLGSLSQQ